MNAATALDGAEPTNPLWVVVLVGALSGVIGAVLGPIIQRTFSRSDKALEARQAWAKAKLQAVFGIGDPPYPTDGPPRVFMRLVPPHTRVAHDYQMHSINWAVEESPDLMLLQPRRSAWAREWLLNWHFRLQGEAKAAHDFWHYHEARYIYDPERMAVHDFKRRMDVVTGQGFGEDDKVLWRVFEKSRKRLERAERRYGKRVRRVESSLAVWATGQWLARPSLWHRVTTWPLMRRFLDWQASQRHPKYDYTDRLFVCTCKDEAIAAEMEAERWRQEAEAAHSASDGAAME